MGDVAADEATAESNALSDWQDAFGLGTSTAAPQPSSSLDWTKITTTGLNDVTSVVGALLGKRPAVPGNAAAAAAAASKTGSSILLYGGLAAAGIVALLILRKHG